MHDELVKRLRDSEHEIDCSLCDRDYCHPDGKVHGKCIIIEAAEVIEDLEFACNRYEKDYKALCAYLPKWIPVTDRFPFAESGNVSEKVLVTDGQDIAIAEWFNFEMCDPYWSYTGMGNITHWMPLPQPPKEG